MAEKVFDWLMVFVLSGVVFLIIVFAYYGKGTGLFSRLADEVSKLGNRFLPVEPRTELKQDQSIPQKVINVQEKFANSIKANLKQSSDKVCRIELSSLSELGDFEMEVSNQKPDNKINFKIIEAKSAELYSSLNLITIENAQICLINPKNFFNCYLSRNRNCEGDMYNDVNIVRINSKKIKIGKEEAHPLAKYMLKTGNNRFCFIPLHGGFGTTYGCDAGKTTLDDDCLKDIEREIPVCGMKLEPEILTDNDKAAIEEFEKFVTFLNELNSARYNKFCRKNFLFNTKIMDGYYIYINPNGQIDLRLNKDGGKIIKRSSIVYIPSGFLSNENSVKEYFDKYDTFKYAFIISPAGDYGTSGERLYVAQGESIIAVSNEKNKLFLTRPYPYINEQPVCA